MSGARTSTRTSCHVLLYTFLQDLEEQKRTKYKINGTATTAIEKSNPNLQAKYSYEYSATISLQVSELYQSIGTQTRAPVLRYSYEYSFSEQQEHSY